MYIKTKTLGSYKLDSSYWGTCYRKIEDPDGLDDQVVELFTLVPPINKIPLDLWHRMVSIFKEYNSLSLEISSVILYNQELDKWRIVIPEQQVTLSSTTRLSFKAFDIESEALLEDYTSDNYIMVGDSHLHPTGIKGDFSSIDDDSELKSPGFHILIHSIKDNNYSVLPSITKFNRRFIVSNPLLLLPIEETYIPNISISPLYKQLVNPLTTTFIKGNKPSKPINTFIFKTQSRTINPELKKDLDTFLKLMENKYGSIALFDIEDLLLDNQYKFVEY
jgi:hypothetical protein